MTTSTGWAQRIRGLILAPILMFGCNGGSKSDITDPALRHAHELLARTILIDGHNDVPWAIREAKDAPCEVAAFDMRKTRPGQTDFARMTAGHVGGQFWSVYIPGTHKDKGFAKEQLEQIDIAKRMITHYPDKLGLALTADDVERVYRSGRVASLLGMEGGHAIENSLGALRAYYDLGARYMTLTHNVTLDWADAGNDDPKHGGLTRFGEEVVHEMNRLGMLVDLSHTSPGTMDDALRVAEAPVIFSHSAARGVCDVPRNVPDDILARLPKNGGIVMVIFESTMVSQEAADTVAPYRAEFRKRSKGVTDDAERDRIWNEVYAGFKMPVVEIGKIADNIEHIRKIAGVDHLGIGSDFDGYITPPVGLEDVSKFPNLFAELIRRGWTDADLEKVAGKNLLRVMREAEAVAQRLQSSRPPSTATIEALDGPQPASGH